jgi:hypothetical protein
MYVRLLKRKMSLSYFTSNYIIRYQRIYKKVISEAQKSENGRSIMAKKKKELENGHKANPNISLEIGYDEKKLTNPNRYMLTSQTRILDNNQSSLTAQKSHMPTQQNI